MKIKELLYIFLEGTDDERYFNSVIIPRLKDKYKKVNPILYANMNKINFLKLIKTFQEQEIDYIFFTDLDSQGDNNYCVTKRKNKTIKNYKSKIEQEQIIVIKEEIESWYLAGITQANLKKYKIKKQNNTELINKEQFHQLIPKDFTSTKDFMIEILKEYSLEYAVGINNSLKYFTGKFSLYI
jgi:hypothetical protein